MTLKENTAFTQKLINKLESDGFEKNPLLGEIMVDWLLRYGRLGAWNGLFVIRHTDNDWHISTGLIHFKITDTSCSAQHAEAQVIS